MSDSRACDSILREILCQNEDAIRAFDIKTEISMLCFVLSVEAAHSFIRYGELQASWPLLAGLLFVVFIAALVAYMLVLFPAHNPELGKGSPRGNAARNVYFVTDPRALSAEDLVQAVASADHAHNLAHEVLKLAAIRNSKRRRFIGALCLTFVSMPCFSWAALPAEQEAPPESPAGNPPGREPDPRPENTSNENCSSVDAAGYPEAFVDSARHPRASGNVAVIIMPFAQALLAIRARPSAQTAPVLQCDRAAR